MAAPHLITGWRALSNAVSDRDWDAAERLANDLAAQLEHQLVADRGKPKGDRDGLWSIGWQFYQAAPRDARRALERFNNALRRMPRSR